jgi:hypothetical protein
VCGQPMTGRQASACSDKCRATKSRRKRAPLPVGEWRDIRASLTVALEAVWEAKATLERYEGRVSAGVAGGGVAGGGSRGMSTRVEGGYSLS